eukprot:TRINITY_DN28191_c0_g1_i1.p1 TRINITY_DN28191_c0_g1~~TRINITY_DN28191_c0_g1_i1.p1  ORF type:complete len:498 (-),score=138.05 TRINITY_DN28191_c0_g1_i1:199-1692(-)
MESPGPESGSEVSYESVASEGGYENACERGRDPLPRIIASSHCIEVYRRLCYVDGAFFQRNTDIDFDYDEGGARAAAAARAYIYLNSGQLEQDCKALAKVSSMLIPHDPLATLPSKLLRFDGAVEAWLGEGVHPSLLPQPIMDPSDRMQPSPPERLYSCVNDAADWLGLDVLSAGNRKAILWYFNLEFLQQLWPFFLHDNRYQNLGLTYWKQTLLERRQTIEGTHQRLGSINMPPKGGKNRQQWLKAVFTALQARSWSPNGEASSLFQQRRLSHLSMSMGDAIQVGDDLYVAGLTGFVQVEQAAFLLPQLQLEAEDRHLINGSGWVGGASSSTKQPEPDEDGTESDEDEDSEDKEEAAEFTSTPAKGGKGNRKGGKGGKGKGKGGDGGGKKGGRREADEDVEDNDGGRGGKKGGKGKKGKKGKGKEGKNGEVAAEYSGKGGGYPAKEYGKGENGGKAEANGEAEPKKKRKNRKKNGNGGGGGYAEENGNQRWVPKSG